jgi:hypothetical protein
MQTTCCTKQLKSKTLIKLGLSILYLIVEQFHYPVKCRKFRLRRNDYVLFSGSDIIVKKSSDAGNFKTVNSESFGVNSCHTYLVP